MEKKIFVVIMTFLMIFSTFVILPNDLNVKADFGEDNEGIGLDMSFIYSTTVDLSKIIYDYPKGRAFGTDGEFYAANNIIKHQMNKMGLYNVTMDPIVEGFNKKLEINEKGLIINGAEYIEDCFITPQWNNSLLWSFIDPPTKNFNYENLEIRKKPSVDWIIVVILSCIDEILIKYSDGTIHDLVSLVEYLLEKIENHYGFLWDDLNETTVYDLPWMQQEQRDIINDFVYIDVNRYCNPDIEPWFWDYDYSPYLESTLDLNWVVGFVERWFYWRFIHHCKGLTLYDFNNDTYDMNLNQYYPLPTIYVNKSIGEPIYNDANYSYPWLSDDYTITYWMDQYLDTKYNR